MLQLAINNNFLLVHLKIHWLWAWVSGLRRKNTNKIEWNIYKYSWVQLYSLTVTVSFDNFLLVYIKTHWLWAWVKGLRRWIRISTIINRLFLNPPYIMYFMFVLYLFLK